MKIERIHVDGFGRLADYDTGADPLGRLVVVDGPNEAGKSTLFSFLTTSLYGFSPASRDTNPHVPWGADQAGGRIHLRTDDGDCIVVERRLRSSPAGSLVRGETTLDLRNQAIDLVRHVPRPVFEQVFAITLAELAGLDDETWARIQDRVLGSMGASDLASVRDVAERLEQQAGEIWRPNRRGNQRLRDLRDEIRALRTRRGEAIRRDREIRDRIEERSSLRARLEDVRHDLKRDRVVIDRIQELLPLKRQLDHVAALRRAAGNRSELEGLPDDLADRLESLSREGERVARELRELEEDARAPRETIDRFDEPARDLLAHRDRIEAFLRVGTASERQRVIEEEEAVRSLDLQIEAVSGPLRDAPLDGPGMAALQALSVDLLRDRILRLDAARSAARQERTGRPSTAPAWSGAALAAVGAGTLVWGGFVSSGPMAGVGAGLLAFGLFLLRTSGPTGGHASSSRPNEIGRLEESVLELLEGLALRPEHLSPPSMHLVTTLDRLKSLVLQRAGRNDALRSARARFDAREESARALAGELGRPTPTDLPSFEQEIERSLREAERAQNAADQARGELERIERSRRRLQEERDRTSEAERSLLARVEALADENGASRVAAVQERIDRHLRADRIEEDLRRTYPDLVDREARIRALDEDGAAWSVSEDELTERRVRVDEAEGQVEELSGRIRELSRDIEHLREEDTVDSVDSAIEALREAEKRLIEKRDRSWVLARLLREADRRFREEHQPDLLRRASDYLRRLTDGRYERLLVDERSDGDLFHLTGPALPRPVPLATPISTGTLEQAYLALRLAIVDHLDLDRERLPLFIDEAFVNWDPARRDRGLEVLAEIAERRQVFAFTCHPDMAERLAAHGGRVLRLRR